MQKISSTLAAECSVMRFGSQVAAVYNPLVYAAKAHSLYLKLTFPPESGPKKVIFLGMNPGPWGMAQTGVPFGEIDAVRLWLGIEAAVDKPEIEHPKRLIEGFACTRSEVSGRRLWGFFRERFGTREIFFREHFVANYCPLAFMDADGANITPDKLPSKESKPLFEICDRALADTIRLLKPQWIIGIGGFAKKRIDGVYEQFFGKEKPGAGGVSKVSCFSTAQILHPSPANPRANAGWEREVIQTLTRLEVWE